MNINYRQFVELNTTLDLCIDYTIVVTPGPSLPQLLNTIVSALEVNPYANTDSIRKVIETKHGSYESTNFHKISLRGSLRD